MCEDKNEKKTQNWTFELQPTPIWNIANKVKIKCNPKWLKILLAWQNSFTHCGELFLGRGPFQGTCSWCHLLKFWTSLCNSRLGRWRNSCLWPQECLHALTCTAQSQAQQQRKSVHWNSTTKVWMHKHFSEVKRIVEVDSKSAMHATCLSWNSTPGELNIHDSTSG